MKDEKSKEKKRGVRGEVKGKMRVGSMGVREGILELGHGRGERDKREVLGSLTHEENIRRVLGETTDLEERLTYIRVRQALR